MSNVLSSRFEVEQAIQKSLEKLLASEVAGDLKGKLLKDLITKVVGEYLEQSKSSGAVDLVLSEKDLKSLTEWVQKSAMAEAGKKSGFVVSSDKQLTAGFKVALKGENVEHDFSTEAITAALSQQLRPQLAELLKSE